MKDLLVEDFRVSLEYLNKTYLFEYKQASIYETIEFIQNDKLIDWLYEFLLRHSKTDWFNKDIFIKTRRWHGEIIKTIETTYFKGAFQKNTTTSTKDKKKDRMDEDNGFWSYLMWMSEILTIEPLLLIKKYTFQQADYLYFRGIYNKNKWTKKWDELNRSMIVWKHIWNMSTNEKKDLDNVFEVLRNLNTKTK